MRLDDFDFDLPGDLIAQHPAEPRDASRLLVLGRSSGQLAHRRFPDLLDLLTPADLLVLNDTRVVAARLVGRRERTGGRWEGLFVRATADGAWELLTQMKGRPSAGEALLADPAEPGDPLRLVLEGKTPAGRWLARPQYDGSPGEILSRFGQVPIPPYIRKGRASADDAGRYQTVYARSDGAVAAPTAGLHFTPELFAELDRRGVGRAFVTLHVGPGTFQPVKAEDLADHRVEPEWGEVPAATADAVRDCKARGGRVVAVGTTTTRVLESATAGAAWSGLAGLTVLPGHRFRTVDALVTNFHLPRSSLLLLVSAFAGYDNTRAAYAEAVRHRYRFYSYGDALFIH
ncbi:MAG: tRNA preQ1(34) S-adenosylmethionine ribosyltransferase-isomerase QueA [Gemmataceae bacterium]